MKKISTLLMMLFAFVGAVSAQTFVEPVTGGFYKLKGDNTDKPWLTNQLNGSSIVVSANESEAAVYLKTANGLMDVATGKYIGMSGSVVSLVNNETTITIGDYKKSDEDKYSVKVSNNYMYNNNTDGKTHGQNALPYFSLFSSDSLESNLINWSLSEALINDVAFTPKFCFKRLP